MLPIVVSKGTLFDEANNKFITLEKDVVLKLEHSLISVSKWESKWKKPFLDGKDKTSEEMLDYIRCMTLNTDVDSKVYLFLSEKNFLDINEYIKDPMTATWFSNEKKKAPSREVITSELIYFSMISFNIPVAFEKWHLNRLLTLIRVCDAKNTPPEKMSKSAAMNKQRALNASRRKALHSKG